MSFRFRRRATHELETIARIIGEGDMGPGISLRAALRAGMASYYPDNPRGAAVLAMGLATVIPDDEDEANTRTPLEKKNDE